MRYLSCMLSIDSHPRVSDWTHEPELYRGYVPVRVKIALYRSDGVYDDPPSTPFGRFERVSALTVE